MIHITSKILIIFPKLIIICYLYIININIIYINRLFCSMDFKYFSNIFSKFYHIFMCNFWSLIRITNLILIFYNNLNKVLFFFFFFFDFLLQKGIYNDFVHIHVFVLNFFHNIILSFFIFVIVFFHLFIVTGFT